MTLALNTTMRACEVKGLQWRDVDFLERTIAVRQSKTDAGGRVIPLNDDAWDATSCSYITVGRRLLAQSQTITFRFDLSDLRFYL